MPVFIYNKSIILNLSICISFRINKKERKKWGKFGPICIKEEICLIHI